LLRELRIRLREQLLLCVARLLQLLRLRRALLALRAQRGLVGLDALLQVTQPGELGLPFAVAPAAFLV
jgi:hypothetical protein